MKRNITPKPGRPAGKPKSFYAVRLERSLLGKVKVYCARRSLSQTLFAEKAFRLFITTQD